MSRRIAELLRVVDRLNKEHKIFVDSHHKEPTDSYWAVVDDVLDTFAEGDIPAECRAMADCVERLQQEIDDLDNGLVFFGRSKFFAIREELATLRHKAEPEEKPPLEPISMLVEQGVTWKQIAQIYGMVDDEGRIRDDHARAEHAVAGSMVGPGKRYPHPDDVRNAARQAILDEIEIIKLEEEEMHKEDGTTAETEEEAEDEPSRCPETWDELFQLKPAIGIEQLAKMKGVSFAKVVDEARKRGYKDYLPASERKGDTYDMQREKILDLHKEGKTKEEIRDALGLENTKRIAAILRDAPKPALVEA